MLLTLALACFGSPSFQQVIELVREPDFVLRARVEPRASIGAEDWLQFEFENLGDEPLRVYYASIHVEVDFVGLTNDPFSVRANLSTLFPVANDPIAVPVIVLAPGETLVASDVLEEDLSLSIGDPGDATWRVDMRFGVKVGIPGRDLTSKLQRPRVAIEWGSMRAAELERMRGRLRELLARSIDDESTARHVRTLFSSPSVAEAASLQDLLAALDRRGPGMESRRCILEHIAQRYRGDVVVRDYYLRSIAELRTHTFSEATLAGAWSSEILEALVQTAAHDAASNAAAMRALIEHHAEWRDDAEIVHRLVQAFHSTARWALAPAQEVPDAALGEWATEVEHWSHLGDESLLRHLRPALEDRRPIYGIWYARDEPYGRLGPLRGCDVALDAVLLVLDGDLEPAYAAANEEQLRFGYDLETETFYASLRDCMILELRTRLADRELR